MKKRLSKKEYENRKYIKSHEKQMTDKLRKVRSDIRNLFKKWDEEDNKDK